MLGDAGDDGDSGGEGHGAGHAVLSSGIICQGLPFLAHDSVFLGVAFLSSPLSIVLPVILGSSISCSLMITAVIY